MGHRVFHYVSDFAVLVGVTDAVSAGVLHGDLLDEEGGVGTVLLLALDDIFEVRLEDIVPEDRLRLSIKMIILAARTSRDSYGTTQ